MRFWPTRPAPVETKSLADPDEQLRQIFGAIPSASGIVVTRDNGLTVPAVSAAVRLVSESAASLDVKVVTIADGEPVPDHPAQRFLSGDANPWTSSFELIRDLIAEAQIIDGGSIAWVNRVGGEIREIVKYDPGVVNQTRKDSGETIYKINDRPIDPANIIHVRAPFSKSPLSLARDAIAEALVMGQYVTAFWKNGARPSGILQSPKSIGDSGVLKMLKGWVAAMSGAANAGKTPVLWDGTTYQQLSLNSVDGELIALRKFAILEIARAFRTPPAMLYDLERATFDNFEGQGKDFLVYSLLPWLIVTAAAMRRALLTEEERKTLTINFEVDDLTRADLGVRATAYSSLIASRVINPNTARKWEGLPPYEGGEDYANPNTGASQPNAGVRDETAPAQDALDDA